MNIWSTYLFVHGDLVNIFVHEDMVNISVHGDLVNIFVHEDMKIWSSYLSMKACIFSLRLKQFVHEDMFKMCVL